MYTELHLDEPADDDVAVLNARAVDDDEVAAAVAVRG